MLEQFGETLANAAQMAAKFQDTLKAENDTAHREHEQFKEALASLLVCCAEHEKALHRALETHEALTKSLLSFGPTADEYQAARSGRIADMIGEQPIDKLLDKAA